VRDGDRVSDLAPVSGDSALLREGSARLLADEGHDVVARSGFRWSSVRRMEDVDSGLGGRWTWWFVAGKTWR
jgi:hypothetical protein